MRSFQILKLISLMDLMVQTMLKPVHACKSLYIMCIMFVQDFHSNYSISGNTSALINLHAKHLKLKFPDFDPFWSFFPSRIQKMALFRFNPYPWILDKKLNLESSKRHFCIKNPHQFSEIRKHPHNFLKIFFGN